MSGRRIGTLGTAVAAAAFATVLLLAGCTSSPVAPPAPARTATDGPSASLSATTKPAPSATPNDATPVTLKCAALVPIGVLASLGGDFATAEADPQPGSDAARIEALRGRTCRWIDRTSNAAVDVSVAKPSKHDLLLLKNDLVERSNSVPTYGEEGYFQLVKKVGQVDAFHGRYWIAAASPLFFEPGDATGLIEAVDDALDGRPPTPSPSPSVSDSAAPPAPAASATP